MMDKASEVNEVTSVSALVAARATDGDRRPMSMATTNTNNFIFVHIPILTRPTEPRQMLQLPDLKQHLSAQMRQAQLLSQWLSIKLFSWSDLMSLDCRNW